VEFLRIEKHMRVEKITFSTISKQTVLDFLEWLESVRQCSPASRNHRLSIIRTFLSYAGGLDCTQIALELDIKRIPMKKHQQTIVDFLSENALKILLEQPNTRKLNGIRDRFFMALMYDTAARCSEMLDLKICDLRINTSDPEAHLLGKGNKIQAVPLMEKTVEHYRHYLNIFHPDADNTSRDYLFYVVTHAQSHRMSPDAVSAFMKKYGESARKICPEIPTRVHAHQLRHSRAIHFYRKGMPLALVGEYLGHVSLESTKIYAYADTEMKRKAMEKIDSNFIDMSTPIPMWQDNEDMILKLSGLR
jgi:site-specific recombinase XerD